MRARPHRTGRRLGRARCGASGRNRFSAVQAGRAPAARGTASGVARYGYGGYRGYGYGYGYPYYGYGYPYYSYWGSWWYPWWGVGWYGGCWDCYGPGYYTYAPSTTYVSGGDEAPARRDPATIETKVSPSSATVNVDGEEFGFASDYDGKWDHLTVSPGKHSIAFRAKGHRSLTVEVEAEPGATYVFKDALAKGEGEDSRMVATRAAPPPPLETAPMGRPAAAATGRLRIHAEPADAAIYLDGEYLGLAAELARIHAALAVPAGTHRLEAVRPGFATAVRTVEVGETDLAVVELNLDAEP